MLAYRLLKNINRNHFAPYKKPIDFQYTKFRRNRKCGCLSNVNFENRKIPSKFDFRVNKLSINKGDAAALTFAMDICFFNAS